MQISFFQKGVSQKIPTSEISVSEFLEQIADGTYQNIIENYRNTLFVNSLKAKEEKKKLPNVTFGGTFHTLDTNKPLQERLISASGFLVLDFDDVAEDLAALNFEKEKLSESNFVYAIFISPSGTGLKVLCKYSGDILHAFTALEKHFSEKFLMQLDKSGKDITRRCFVSYDKEIYINEKAIVTAGLPELRKPKEKAASKIPAAKLAQELKRASDIISILEVKKIDLTENYQAWINIGMAFATYGEEGRELFHRISAINGNYKPDECDKKFDNFLSTTKFNNPAYFFNSCKNAGINISTSQPQKKETAAASQPEIIPDGNEQVSINEFFQKIDIPVNEFLVTGEPEENESFCIWKGNFWVKTRRWIEKTGELETKYIFKYVDFRKFLENAGFYQMINQLKGKGNTYEFIRIHKNIIKSVNEDEIRELIDKWIREHELTEVEETMTRGGKTYFGNDKLKKIPAQKIKFKRDTKHSAFYYFQNCFVEVTEKDVITHSYETLKGNIWLSQVKDHDFTLVEKTDSVFDRFLQLAVNGSEYSEKWSEEMEKKYHAVISGIGYILHGYKDPVTAKTFNKFDAFITRDRRPEGRSGKSLTDKAIGHVIPAVEIDATGINKPDTDLTKFLTAVSHDTRYVYFNDASHSFPFNNLFHMITESTTIKRLYLDPITLEYDVSPKYGINTNYVLKGEGGSFNARQFNVEYSNFFNIDNSPSDHFKHIFFNDWDAAEWNNFYSNMFEYVQIYMKFGLEKFPSMNYDLRKLMASISDPDFLDFFQEDLIEISEGTYGDKINFKDGEKHKVKDLFEAYKKYSPDYKEVKQNTFSRWMEKCAEYFGYDKNPLQGGKRHRQDGEDFFTFKKKIA